MSEYKSRERGDLENVIDCVLFLFKIILLRDIRISEISKYQISGYRNNIYDINKNIRILCFLF